MHFSMSARAKKSSPFPYNHSISGVSANFSNNRQRYSAKVKANTSIDDTAKGGLTQF